MTQFIYILVACCLLVAGGFGWFLWWRRRTSDSSFSAFLEIAGELEDERQIATVVMTAARYREGSLKEELRRISKMKDPERRRQALLHLYQEVSE
jgi:hypothetical protein